VLKALCAAEIIVVDRSAMALGLARECGAHHVVQGGPGELDEVMKLTKGNGAEAVIDFVGEGTAVAQGLAMTRNAGYYYIVGYGGKVEIATMEMIVTEKTIVGNLVGTYPDLVELMALADRGLVNLATKEYKLSAANSALQDLKNGKVKGRAVLVP
jgi:NAD+-dependent secondary alcohol dehydrogenase Adh1